MLIRALGPLEVRDDNGGWRRIASSKQRLLLAILLVSPGIVSAARLIEELWPEKRPADPANQLHVQVCRLRKAMDVTDGVTLRTHAGAYELTGTTADLDITDFESLARQGTDYLERGENKEAATTLADALRLWRGVPFADVGLAGPDSAVSMAVRHLTGLRASAREARVEAELRCGRHHDLVPELQALVSDEPYHEAYWSQLMLALYRSGRQADALAAYRRLRDLLDAELGIAPCRSVSGLHQRMLSADPGLDLEKPRRQPDHFRPKKRSRVCPDRSVSTSNRFLPIRTTHRPSSRP